MIIKVRKLLHCRREQEARVYHDETAKLYKKHCISIVMTSHYVL